LLYAVAGFNVLNVTLSARNVEMIQDKEGVIHYFTEQYRKMLIENLDKYVVPVTRSTIPMANRKLDLQVGQEHIVVQRRYEAVGALNDLLIAVWFLVGSFFFLSNSLVGRGTWLFIVGSAQLLIKPAIKLSSLVHVNHVYQTQVEKNNNMDADQPALQAEPVEKGSKIDHG